MRNRSLTIAVLSLLILNVIPGMAQTSAPANSPSSAEVERRVETLLGKMTLEEKIDMLGGVNDFFVRGFPRLGLPPLKMADGPVGVRNYGPATAMAGGSILVPPSKPGPGRPGGTQILRG